jgi:hypothetical protein
LKLLTLHGTLKLGKEPLAARLWFGGRFGGLSVELESDSDGKFHGVLPKDGWWPIDVESSSPPFKLRTKAKVQALDHERASVDIVLPATHLFGRVVMDDTGRPAGHADVSLGTDEGDMTKRGASNTAGSRRARSTPRPTSPRARGSGPATGPCSPSAKGRTSARSLRLDLSKPQ